MDEPIINLYLVIPGNYFNFIKGNQFKSLPIRFFIFKKTHLFISENKAEELAFDQSYWDKRITQTVIMKFLINKDKLSSYINEDIFSFEKPEASVINIMKLNEAIIGLIEIHKVINY